MLENPRLHSRGFSDISSTILPSRSVAWIIFWDCCWDGYPKYCWYPNIKKELEIKAKANHFIAIHSDNDPYVPLKHADIFKEKLGAKIKIMHNIGYFFGPVDDTKSTITLPEVTASILEISN